MQQGNDNSGRPDIRAYVGTTGSGKGVSVRAHLRDTKPARLLIWDPLGEYGEFVTRTVARIDQLALAAKAPAFRVAFYPGPDSEKFADPFALFCRIAFAAGDLTMLVEELADVTRPSWAPMPWRRCTKQGRHRKLKIVAATQRPADVDKNFLGAATMIRCFMLGEPADEKTMAERLRVPLADVQQLVTVEKGSTTTINYLERDVRARNTTPGSLKLTRRR